MMFSKSDILEALNTNGSRLNLEHSRCVSFENKCFIDYCLEYNETYKLIDNIVGQRKSVEWSYNSVPQGGWFLPGFIESHREDKYKIYYVNENGRKIHKEKMFAYFWVNVFIPEMRKFCLKNKLERELKSNNNKTRRTKI
ncbi:hypothetical protein JAO10_07755 [Burkholderia contaminans]|uniref:hypothetical protein n=1 Tax=Burkholderia cepacia complex TaxID=87882 RepID=UPI0011775710|nr:MULTISPECIES: hypothetical protein [Burkholderia cepacia complex]MBH9720223.1 hypothetical protein [Burkholderia contaminans]MBR8013464.1 hypothetical protein [Burkholderia vietnamiensis]HDR9039756.1 hypothetical protein [Burkholderia vietnamiensis]HDR9168068.1 hypothetical protein [Burkholderia vietnamiensis]HDR9196433.1 hypothetical protein [Burkholderia vietnamiensis]